MFRTIDAIVLFVVGCVFIGAAIAADFDPMRAFAGCALVYVSRWSLIERVRHLA